MIKIGLLITFSFFLNLITYAQESEIQVKIFFATECPISQKYVTRLNAIHQNYSTRGVTFVAIFPGKIKRSDVLKFVEDYDLAIEVKFDKRMQLVKLFKATIIPEVVVLKGKEVMYQGAIDNWFYELGKYRKEITESYLVNALEAILAGKEPNIKKTEAIGCFIEI